jgi:dsDNA-specific endonuclease/ATPase MutS2
MLNDPKVRLAYVVTKVAVFGVAALATWPLSRMIGPKAWVGLGVFGAILITMTAIALIATSKGSDVETVSDIDDGKSDVDAVVDPNQPVEHPIEDSIDLHPFAPRDVPDVVDAYLEAAFEKGLREVRLIHGRGVGVQRDRVQKLLGRHPLVSGFHDAPPERGGWGATVAYLKPAE